MITNVIRPGILVALRSSVRGGVHYERVDIEQDGKRARWETTRTIEEPEEHEQAIKTRAQALREVRRECNRTSFGLLCPLGAEGALDAAVERAREKIREFNRAAKVTRISLHILKGRIADTDEEAARAIADEVAELLGAMNDGIAQLDVKTIRDAAKRARELAGMLDEKTEEALGAAITQARKAAREIVKRVEKQGEAAEIVLADVAARRGLIEKARIAFIDITDSGDDEPVESLPAVEAQRFADLEMEEVA